MTIEFKLPNLGEGVEGGNVVNVLVSVGDTVKPEQDIFEMETDKAVVPVSSPYNGVIEAVHIEAGQRVSVGDRIVTLRENGTGGDSSATAQAPPERETTETASARAEPAAPEREERAAEEPREEMRASAAEAEAPAAPRSTAIETAPRVARDGDGDRSARPPAPAGPATRRLARELGVDLYEVRGTGPGGRITREDVKAYVKTILSHGGPATSRSVDLPPLPDFSQWGEIERSPISGIRRATAEAMSVSHRVIPQVTQFDEADITRLEAARRRYERSRAEGDPKITVTAIVLKAVVSALRRFPQFNSSFDAARGEIIFKKYFHVGIAVDTEHGLLVPVIRDVDRKTVSELAKEMADLSARARSRKVDLAELRGASFTITNLGGIGGTAFTPIVNHPEVAILGLSRSRQDLYLQDGKVKSRLVLPLSLSYDHRVIDGADAARFVRFLATSLEDPFQLLIDV